MLDRVDTVALKRRHPLVDVVARYGLAVRPIGRALVGRCPFHADAGRANLHLYVRSDPAVDRYVCYRCGAAGDAIDFVERLEGVGFRAAVERIDGPAVVRADRRAAAPPAAARPVLGPAEHACLAAAVELYASRLRVEPAPQAYLAGRGLDPGALARQRVGFAAGDELIDYLLWHGLPLAGAFGVGLLRRDGREHLAGRVVVPELRAGRPVWLVGRVVPPAGPVPTYLGLPGPKPLLGWESVQGAPAVWVVEGPLDYLVLRQWGLPSLALGGTRARPETVAALGRFPVVYLALDADEAGRAATAELRRALGGRAVPVPLPGVADPAELALVPDGRALLLRAARRARPASAA